MRPPTSPARSCPWRACASLARRRVLVCGATGFIGRNVAEALARRSDLEVRGTRLESEPYGLDGVTFDRVDLRVPEQVERVVEGADVIVQAAATTSGALDIVNRPHHHVTDNAVMNSLLFRAALERGVSQVIFFSCTVMYPSSDAPLPEEAFDANVPMYERYFGVGWTKVYLEKMCEFYARLGGPRFTVIRHSNVYGPHDKYDLERSHVFGATVTKVLTADDGRVVVWGAGEEARDLLHVSDLVRFVELAIDQEKEPFGLYNVGSGEMIRVKDLVRRIVEGSGRSLRIEHDLRRPSLETKLRLDCRRARERLGWEPRVSLEEGIARTLEWYRENVPL